LRERVKWVDEGEGTRRNGRTVKGGKEKGWTTGGIL